MSRMNVIKPSQFQGVHLNAIPFVEDLVTFDNLLYDFDVVDGNIVGELARRSLQNYGDTVRY